MKKKRSKMLPGLALAAGLVVVGWGLWGDSLADEEDGVIPGAQVQRGPLRISVIERGNLKAADSVTLINEIEGQTTVLYLIDEGTEVEVGQLVCELDTASLMDGKVEQEIQVQNASAAHVKAEQDYKIQESQNLSDIERAKREKEFAKIDLVKYMEGDKRQELERADEEILLATEELERAGQDYEWSQRLAERGFLEQSQLDADRLAMTRYEVAQKQANRSKELLITYEIPRRESELQAEVDEKDRELERVMLQARARIVDYEANLAIAEARHNLERDELAKMESQIDKAKLYAPVEGMVVYAVEKSHRYGSGTPMQEGSSVRERQEIITIPSAKGYVAEASLHESVLEKVQSGMPCLVTVDAVEGTFRGRVGFKAVLPDQNSWFANPDLRVYRTEIEIVDSDPRLRPGMSCSIEILVDEMEDALFVPVQSVFLDAGSPVALVPDGTQIDKREIDVGQNNGKWVEVRSGLSEGETVLLSAPGSVAFTPAPEHREGEPAADWGTAPTGGSDRPGGQGMQRAGGHQAGAEHGGGHSGGKPGGKPKGGEHGVREARAGGGGQHGRGDRSGS